MLLCGECHEQFEDSDSAMEHIRQNHHHLVDEELQEFVTEAETAVYDQLITGSEE